MSRGLFVGALVIGMLAVTPPASSALDPGGSFTDDNSSVHEGAIEAIADEGITKGCNPPVNDLFCPTATVTREQMATFLVRALDLPAGSAGFTDLGTSVHAANIAALASAGITKGCNPPDNTLFCPTATVTREQMATFLVRALGLPAGSASFTDVGSSVHAANIGALASAGITKGCNPPDNTLFCPTSPVTREQMATFLSRALNLDPITPPPPLPAISPSNFVTYGAQNWLFFSETVDRACVPAEAYDRLIAEIEKAKLIVTETNRGFVYAIPPDKAVVYPNQIPGFAGSCAEQNSEMLQSALATAADPNRVDLWAPFGAATDTMYWKHDTHWNVGGALLGSELIASKAAPGVWGQLDLVGSPAIRQGDLATLIGVDWVIEYDDQTPTLAGVTPDVEVHSSITISNRPLVTYTSPSNLVLVDDRTAVIHDSFGMFFRNKLGPLFEDVTFVPTFSHPIPDGAQGFISDTSQIVIEVVERNVLREFLGTGMAGTLAAMLADSFARTTVSHTRNGEFVTFDIPGGTPGDLRYLIVELDTSGLSAPVFIGDPSELGSGDQWPDEIAPGASLYGFEVLVDSGTMELPLPSSVTVHDAYVIVIE